mmetsp:Transcript_6034/g.17832  ORF Transcript_6034/g.17832 Transcript_6034/m.17832 type:complete len:256 (-) Transcript_6034:35-802(-)
MKCAMARLCHASANAGRRSMASEKLRTASSSRSLSMCTAPRRTAALASSSPEWCQTRQSASSAAVRSLFPEPSSLLTGSRSTLSNACSAALDRLCNASSPGLDRQGPLARSSKACTAASLSPSGSSPVTPAAVVAGRAFGPRLPRVETAPPRGCLLATWRGELWRAASKCALTAAAAAASRSGWPGVLQRLTRAPPAAQAVPRAAQRPGKAAGPAPDVPAGRRCNRRSSRPLDGSVRCKAGATARMACCREQMQV